MKTAARLLICFLFTIFSAQTFAQEVNRPPIAKQGILDLRNTDIGSKPVLLHGDWNFYWQQLLEPKDLHSGNKEYAPFPQQWKNQQQHGKTLSPTGYASYSLLVLLPKQRPSLALEVPSVYSSYKLFINGRLFAENGKPTTSAATAVPFWSTKLNALDNQHMIPCSLFCRWLISGMQREAHMKRLYWAIKKQLFLKHHRNTALDLVLAGCLFMGGLFFWGLSVFGRNDKIIFYFSLFCIVTSYRMIGTELYVLHSLFPGLSWFVCIRLEYLTLVLGVALFSQYTRMLYPKDASRAIMKAIIWLCLLYAGIILAHAARYFTALA